MKKKKGTSIYQALGQEIQEQARKNLLTERVDINQTIRRIRTEKGLSGVSLCERAGDLDPRTLTAVEKGRIKNPSVKTLHSIARGLSLTISDLFRQAEMGIDRHFYVGSQKGAFQLDFPWLGIRAISFTPFMKNFFCGKLIFSAKRRLDETLLKHPLPIFVWVLVGRFEVKVEGRKIDLREGDNLSFNGVLKHSFSNPLHRESVLLIVTAPSFL